MQTNCPKFLVDGFFSLLNSYFLRYALKSNNQIVETRKDHDFGISSDSEGNVYEYQGSKENVEKISLAMNNELPSPDPVDDISSDLLKTKKEVAILKDKILTLEKEKLELMKAFKLSSEKGTLAFIIIIVTRTNPNKFFDSFTSKKHCPM